jgi:hypothetical protein
VIQADTQPGQRAISSSATCPPSDQPTTTARSMRSASSSAIAASAKPWIE